MRALASTAGVLLLLALGFFIYDVLDFAIGAWVIFGALGGYVGLRLIGFLPGGDVDGDFDV